MTKIMSIKEIREMYADARITAEEHMDRVNEIIAKKNEQYRKDREEKRKVMEDEISKTIQQNPPYTHEELMKCDVEEGYNNLQGIFYMAGIRETLNERGTKYGAFKDNATIAQKLKMIWRNSPGGQLTQVNDWTPNNLAPITCHTINEGMEMILHKIARICNGDPEYLDSWVDIVGYAQLVVDHLRREQDTREKGKRAAHEQEQLRRQSNIQNTSDMANQSATSCTEESLSGRRSSGCCKNNS